MTKTLRENTDTTRYKTPIRKYVLYVTVAAVLFGVMVLAAQTGNLIATLAVFTMYSAWCVYHITTK